VTQVDFHIGIEDRVAYGCRLVRKVLASGAQALILGDALLLRRMDAALWADEAAGFIPHAMSDAPPAVAARSPVLLTEQIPKDLALQAVLINMSGHLPEDLHSRERVIELVSAEEQAIEDARQRWKRYKQRGFTLVNHDVRQRAVGKAADSG
jgi:DNA polymerase III subunit chi